MGKKKCRASTVSKGERPAQNRKKLLMTRRLVRPVDRYLDKLKAWRLGKNPWMTIDNPDKGATRERFIKIKSNDLLGDPKHVKPFVMKHAS